MGVFVAIDIRDNDAMLVTAEGTTPQDITILGVENISLQPHPAPTEELRAESQTHPEGTETADAAAAPFVIADPSLAERSIAESAGEAHLHHYLIDIGVDATLAVLPSDQILYETVTLPFRDPKKLEQVVPLQVQDMVPFELDDFVIDPLVLGTAKDQKFDILASMAPQSKVASSLLRLKQLGADPKVLSTRSSAVAALTKLMPETLQGSYALITVSQERCIAAFFIESELKSLREFEIFSSLEVPGQLLSICRDLRVAIAKIEKDLDKRFEKCVLIGRDDLLSPFLKYLDLAVEVVDLRQLYQVAPDIHVNGHDITWALGLFVHELQRQPRLPLVNFRRGQFAYKPTLGNILNALREEFFYIGLAVLLGAFWLITTVFSSYSAINRVEDAIESLVKTGVPSLSVPHRGEAPFMRNEVEQLENSLRGLGSLSSLSPLESLKELSLLIDQSINIQIEAVNVGHEGLSFRGTVPDPTTVGRLNTALEKAEDKFCKVEVNAKGRAPGSERVKFQADITFCK